MGDPKLRLNSLHTPSHPYHTPLFSPLPPSIRIFAQLTYPNPEVALALPSYQYRLIKTRKEKEKSVLTPISNLPHKILHRTPIRRRHRLLRNTPTSIIKALALIHRLL